MYVCTYVRMYVCMCVCMYVCMYVCVYIRMYIRDDRGQHHFAPGEVRLRLPLDVAIRSIQFCPQDLSFFLLYKRCNSFWFHAQVRTTPSRPSLLGHQRPFLSFYTVVGALTASSRTTDQRIPCGPWTRTLRPKCFLCFTRRPRC